MSFSSLTCVKTCDMNFSALEDLSGDIRIFGKTWTFSKRSVETGKLQHSVVSL